MEQAELAKLLQTYKDAMSIKQKLDTPKIVLQEHQKPPEGDWRVWLFMGGRGTGKSQLGSWFVNNHALSAKCGSHDLPHRMLIISTTLGSAADSCFLSPAGIKNLNPEVKIGTSIGGTFLKWPNGSMAKLAGGDTVTAVEQLRPAGNTCLVWLEEWAAMKYMKEVFEQADLGCRLGEHPRIIITTTPKPRKAMRDLVERAKTEDEVKQTYGWMNQNKFLDERVRKTLIRTYTGSKIEAQELHGILQNEVDGALWRYDLISDNRVAADFKVDFSEIVIAIDPAVSVTADSDETGIVVVGKTPNGHGYLLHDASGVYYPHQWAQIVAKLYKQFKADMIVAEDNNGGLMVEETLKVVDSNLPIKRVHASRGKRVRAEPVAQAYHSGLIHHVGSYDKLEEQLTTWTPNSPDSPDRLDALVWGFSYLGFGVGDWSTFLQDDDMEATWFTDDPVTHRDVSSIKAEVDENDWSALFD